MGDAGRRFEKMADCDQETHTPPPTLAMLFRYSQLEHSSSSSSSKKRASDWYGLWIRHHFFSSFGIICLTMMCLC